MNKLYQIIVPRGKWREVDMSRVFGWGLCKEGYTAKTTLTPLQRFLNNNKHIKGLVISEVDND